MPISLSELKRRLEELLTGTDPDNYTNVMGRISEFLQFSVENYDSLDNEAKKYVDSSFDKLGATCHSAIEAFPEGIEKRRTARLLAIAEGEHFRVEDLLASLESAPQMEAPILPAARATFMQLLQYALDVLHDGTRNTHKGAANFAKVGLCFWAIDELLVAIHLAQRAFTNQAYAHIRTVFEVLDEVELFRAQPQWAELWVSGDDKKVWNELRPSAVRKKLGEPKVDPIYSFFSEFGPHGTFRGLQARTAKITSTGKDSTAMQVSLWVGGSPQEHHVVWTNTFCVYAVLKTLLKCIAVFGDHLNPEEMNGVLESALDLAGQFFREHYLEWAKRNKLDTNQVESLLDKSRWKAGTFPGAS